MQVISVNVGQPRQVEWKNKIVSTGIFKTPVQGRITVRKLNLDGDRQADLTVHGGPDKAIYAYPVEYYDYWRVQFPDMELGWGMFGENLTVEGLSDVTVHIGDRFRVGTVELVVTQPRFPCYKLGIKFGRDEMVKLFLEQGYTGFYFRVLVEGEIAAGDSIELLSQDEQQVQVADIVRLYVRDKNDLEGLQRAVKVEALAEGWKEHFQKRIDKIRIGEA